MSQNVLEQLDGKKTLLAKLRANEELTSIVMGLLVRIVYMAQVEKSKPVKGITIDGPYMTGAQITARLTFNSIALSGSSMWTMKHDFVDYVGGRNAKLAQALSDNPRLGKFFEDVVGQLEQVAAWKSWRFEDMTFTKHIITQDDVIVLEVACRP
jgi:hypothetical protein